MLTDVVIANKSYTKLNVPEKSGVDSIALRVMKQDCPDFLLPTKTMEIDGELEIRYELLEGVRLSYSSPEMSKRDFVALLRNMLTPFKICNDWFLDYHNILLDANYVLIGRNGMAVKYVYIPVAEYAQSDKAIADFFYDCIVHIDVIDDLRYTTNLLRLLKRDGSNLMTLLDYITQEELPAPREQSPTPDSERDMPVNREPIQGGGRTETQSGRSIVQDMPKEDKAKPKPVPAEPAVGNRGIGAARPGQASKDFGKQDVEGKLVGNLFGDDDDEEEPNEKVKKGAKPPKEKAQKEKGGGLLGIFKGTPKSNEQTQKAGRQNESILHSPAQEPVSFYEVPDTDKKAHGNIASYYEDDKTEIPDEEEVVDSNTIKLRLENNAGRDDCPPFIEISLQRGFATVGRADKSGHNQSDYNFDSSFTFISRRHFRIEKNQDEWRIIDLGSANGTFVNGEPLVPNMPYPLHSGDTVMISRKHRLTYRVC